MRTSRACSRAFEVTWVTVGGSFSSSGCRVVSTNSRGRLGQLVDLVDALGHALAHLVDGLVQ